MHGRRWLSSALIVIAACAGDGGRTVDRGMKKQAEARPSASVASASPGSVPAAFNDAVAEAHVRFASATVDDLAKRAPAFQAPAPADLSTVQYLDRILEPVTHGQKNPAYALKPNEQHVLKTNRFVSSERLGDMTYAALYHRIYEHDQPVLVTTDSVLHAFHSSYDDLLEQLETQLLIEDVQTVLDAMSRRIEAAQTAHANDALHDAVRDADIFIGVARTLLAGDPIPTIDPANQPAARAIAGAIHDEQVARVKLFGSDREEDFSQMKPRGHYTNSLELRRYFRTMMWLGRTEFRLAGRDAKLEELGAAIVLHELLVRSAELPRWQRLDKLIQTYVGPADAMTAGELDQLLRLRPTSGPIQQAELKALQNQIAEAKLGAQQINSQLRVADPDSSKPTPIPQVFAFFPQRFTVDSWVLSQLVFDRARYEGMPVEREIPSGVDVAFSALGNDAAAAVLARRIEDKDGVPERDGLPIQASLLATRAVIDARPPEAWTKNLYEGWLNALRALSEPTVDDRYPSVMRSEAWANRRMQTQLASWAELRHDTILYVKQSYGMVSCEYPAGFVELQPLFWERLEQAARLAEHALDDFQTPKGKEWVKEASTVHWKKFAETMATLHRISVQELASKPLDDKQLKFLKEVVEVTDAGGCGGPPRWSGWFVELYYGGSHNATEWSPLVADVHTSPKHGSFSVATGGVDLTVAIIERGEHTMAFAGPTAQYFEMVTGATRLNDGEWKDKLSSRRAPDRPEWTSEWLVAGKAPYLRH